MKSKSNQRGFTLIELIVVVAIMGIIASVLVPQFSTMILRSRMSTDVATVKTINNQIEIYYATNGVWPTGMTEGNVDSVMNELVDKQYLDPKYLTDGNKVKLQTPSGAISIANNHLILTVSQDDYNQFNEGNDKDTWVAVTGGQPTDDSGNGTQGGE